MYVTEIQCFKILKCGKNGTIIAHNYYLFRLKPSYIRIKK